MIRLPEQAANEHTTFELCFHQTDGFGSCYPVIVANLHKYAYYFHNALVNLYNRIDEFNLQSHSG